MDQSYELENNERMAAEQLSAQHRDLLARYGACSLEMESIRAALPQITDKQKELIGRVAQSRGVTQYLAARIEGGALICRVPDAPVAGHINGAFGPIGPS
jgi:hypothetical protein